MTPSGSEADARIAIDDLLRAAGWDPRDKSQIGTEILSGGSDRSPRFTTRAEARPFDTHAPVYELAAAAGAFGPDRVVGTATDELGWMPVPGHNRLTRDHFVARVAGRSMEPTIPDGSHCLFRTDRGGSRDGKLLLVWQLRPLRPARPAAGGDRGQEERHQPLRGQAAGAAVREGPRRAFHLGPTSTTSTTTRLPSRSSGLTRRRIA